MPTNSVFSSEFDNNHSKATAAKSQSTNPMNFKDMIAPSPGLAKSHIMN